MLKLSPCIEMLFNEVDFYKRFAAAKECSVEAVDMWGLRFSDKDKIKDILKKLNLTISSAVVESTNQEVCDIFYKNKLLYADAQSLNAFYVACEESLEYAKELKIPSLIVTVGQERNDITRYEQHTNIVLALKKVAPLFENYNINLVVEPLNILIDHKGYFLSSSYEAFSICEEVGSKNIKVLYDIYHQQVTEGNLITTIRKYFHLIGHFHVADAPGRHEIDTGEINYKNVFSAIDELGYDGYIGLEYSPIADSKKTVLDAQKLILSISK